MNGNSVRLPSCPCFVTYPCLCVYGLWVGLMLMIDDQEWFQKLVGLPEENGAGFWSVRHAI